MASAQELELSFKGKIMRKLKFTNPIATITLIILIIFSIVIFPFILAATPGNREIETVETEIGLTADKPLGSVNPDGTTYIPDINAISKETAIEIVVNTHEILSDNNGYTEIILDDYSTYLYSMELRSVRYIEATDYIDAPTWQLLYYENVYTKHLIPVDGESPEEFLNRIGVGLRNCCETLIISSLNDGRPALVNEINIEIITVFAVNAFNGKLTGQESLYLCNHRDRLESFTYDDATDWDFFREHSDYLYSRHDKFNELHQMREEERRQSTNVYEGESSTLPTPMP